MFNLLPEDIRKIIKTEYKLRLVIISIIFIIALQLSLLVFMFPTWLSSFYKEKDMVAKTMDLDTSLSTLDINSTTSFIKSLNITLRNLDDNLEYPRFIPILDNLLSKKASSIKITALNYNVDSKNTGNITLVGIGSSRESLVSFTDKLKEITYFKKVDLPISNLAKDKDINFSINISIEK